MFETTLDGGETRQLTDDAALEISPAFGAADKADAVVNVASLNVRSSPGTGAGVIETMTQGTPLKIIGRLADNSWVQVTTPKGKTGWMFTKSLDVSIDLSSVPIVKAKLVLPPPTAQPTAVPTAIPTTVNTGGNGGGSQPPPTQNGPGGGSGDSGGSGDGGNGT